jgi:hypothetical protein
MHSQVLVIMIIKDRVESMSLKVQTRTFKA